jgi:hypothetical protein
MGQTKTPRPVYFKNGVVEFYVRDKVVHYKTVLWSKDRLVQFVFDQGKYDGDSDEIVKKASQTFGDVSGSHNLSSVRGEE